MLQDGLSFDSFWTAQLNRFKTSYFLSILKDWKGNPSDTNFFSARDVGSLGYIIS
jgi:hypothetical protein